MLITLARVKALSQSVHGPREAPPPRLLSPSASAWARAETARRRRFPFPRGRRRDWRNQTPARAGKASGALGEQARPGPEQGGGQGLGDFPKPRRHLELCPGKPKVGSCCGWPWREEAGRAQALGRVASPQDEVGPAGCGSDRCQARSDEVCREARHTCVPSGTVARTGLQRAGACFAVAAEDAPSPRWRAGWAPGELGSRPVAVLISDGTVWVFTPGVGRTSDADSVQRGKYQRRWCGQGQDGADQEVVPGTGATGLGCPPGRGYRAPWLFDSRMIYTNPL